MFLVVTNISIDKLPLCLSPFSCIIVSTKELKASDSNWIKVSFLFEKKVYIFKYEKAYFGSLPLFIIFVWCLLIFPFLFIRTKCSSLIMFLIVFFQIIPCHNLPWWIQTPGLESHVGKKEFCTWTGRIKRYSLFLLSSWFLNYVASCSWQLRAISMSNFLINTCWIYIYFFKYAIPCHNII